MAKQRRSRKPAVAQDAVLARTLAGQSNLQIAREMGIDRQTVTRIQECHNLPQLLADSRQYTVENVLPKAIRAVEAQLEDRDSKEDGNLGARVMEGVGVLSDNAPKATFSFSDDARLQVALAKLGPHLMVEARWEAAGKPVEGWVWPAPTRSGHLESSSLKKQHMKALRFSGVRPFVLYSLRHTFLTRLGESGCDAWTLARIAGHSSIRISTRYVHPSEDAVFAAISRLGGHNSGHTGQQVSGAASADKLLTA